MTGNTNFVAPVSVEEVRSLSSDTITKKKYDAILEEIENRFSYVFEKAMSIMGRRVEWYDYDNLGEGEDSRGFFDPGLYAEEIGVAGKFNVPAACLYSEYIPTRWLWEDFETALETEVAAHKLAQAAAKDNKKEEAKRLAQKKKDVIESIRQKLTKEELSYITFN